MNENVLPDSRLKSDKGSIMYNWPLADGTTVRIEVVPVFCANCGKPHGYVPKDNTNWAFWLCVKCYEKHGTIAGTYVEPDAEFWKKVEYEMLENFGHHLNEQELAFLQEQGWGALEKLVRESPIKV